MDDLKNSTSTLDLEKSLTKCLHPSDAEHIDSKGDAAVFPPSYILEPSSLMEKDMYYPGVILGEQQGPMNAYLAGFQLHSITTALCLSLFLTNLEIPIVSTSLVGITNALQGFSQSSWVVTAYLLTYIGFLIIWAKLSDIFGRKTSAITAVLLFTVFSGACGAAKTMTQLIILRAFQGIGGSGIYAVCIAIMFELVPQEKYASYTMIVSMVFTLSLLLGPILGGVISNSQWRWVFLLNVPAGAVAASVLAIMLPNGFPNHGKTRYINGWRDTWVNLKRVDFVGATLLLTATIILIVALEEAGVRFPWKSAFVITLLAVSGILWIVFLIWERMITLKEGSREPVFPWRFIRRVWICMLLNGFFLGAPFTAAIFLIPQRFMVVNDVSPLGAGVRLLPFTFLCPIGSIFASVIAKAKVPPIYLLIVGSALQVIGFSLLSTIHITQSIGTTQYVFEIIAGFGVGMNISTLILMTPFCVEDRDKAVAVGAISQFRYLGGAIGLAIVANILNSFLNSRLSQLLSPEEVALLLQCSDVVQSFSPGLQEFIREAFGDGYNIMIKVLAGISAAQLPAAILMWKRNQIVVK